MEQISAQMFLEGVESGIIIEVFSIGRRVYGKSAAGNFLKGKLFKVVWADIP